MVDASTWEYVRSLMHSFSLKLLSFIITY